MEPDEELNFNDVWTLEIPTPERKVGDMVWDSSGVLMIWDGHSMVPAATEKPDPLPMREFIQNLSIEQRMAIMAEWEELEKASVIPDDALIRKMTQKHRQQLAGRQNTVGVSWINMKDFAYEVYRVHASQMFQEPPL